MNIIDKIAHALHLDRHDHHKQDKASTEVHAELASPKVLEQHDGKHDAQQKRRAMTCSHCGGAGHTARKCPAKIEADRRCEPAPELSDAGSGGDHGTSSS